jgi:hypothetical protein
VATREREREREKDKPWGVFRTVRIFSILSDGGNLLRANNMPKTALQHGNYVTNALRESTPIASVPKPNTIQVRFF